jgi:hypothetical protein
MKITKSMILPFVTVLVGGYTLITKDAVSKDAVDTITNISVIVIGAAVNVWGIFKTHEKEVKK